jgi:hypothetical protein
MPYCGRDLKTLSMQQSLHIMEKLGEHVRMIADHRRLVGAGSVWQTATEIPVIYLIAVSAVLIFTNIFTYTLLLFLF